MLRQYESNPWALQCLPSNPNFRSHPAPCQVLNVARLVNCTQQYAEQQEVEQREGLAEVCRRLAALEARIEGLAEPQRAAEQRLGALEGAMEDKLKVGW